MSALFIDVDSQLDFVYPAGALYVPGAEKVVAAIAQLNAYAAQHEIPVISTVDAHTENDPEFQTWPKHCVAGTLGQQKPAATLLSRRIVVPNREGGVSIAGAQQIILEKQTTDAFQTRTMAAVVAGLNPDRFIVYGVVTEICVLQAIRGLVKLGKPVTIILHAVRHLTEQGFESAVAEMRSAGVMISTSPELPV